MRLTGLKIGVLALQGDFAEHEAALEKLGAEHFEIRQKKDIEQGLDALVLPGGESTTMGTLLRELELFEPLKEKIECGMPVFGTCAGLLLLAKNIENDSARHFALMDITAKRNAYGRQLGSFHTEAEFKPLGTVPMTFIRAPYITEVSGSTKVLAEVDGRIVAARDRSMLAISFHPELDGDLRVYEYFLSMVRAERI